MNEVEMKQRTKQFAIRVVRVAEALPNTRTGNHVAGQLLRSGTSVGSNYRASCRAKSTADMLAKLAIVEEEVDESAFWLEFIIDTEMLPAVKLAELLDEANQLTAIMVASIKTLRKSASAPKSKIQNPK